jgi:hypothetical protein
MTGKTGDETETLRDAAFNPFRPRVDPINGVDLSMMIGNLKLTTAQRLAKNTGSAINIARLRNAARRVR